MVSKLFEGGEYKGDYKPLLPEYYPPDYQKYIDEEMYWLKETIKGAGNVLEAGVGIGRLIPHISTMVGKLVGIDESNFMVEKSKEVASTFSNVEIKKMNIEEIASKYPNDFFDYSLLMWNTLGNVQSEVEVLRALSEVTRKGIIITVHKKGALDRRQDWYKAVGIKIKDTDFESETVLTEDGLKSKAYSLEDIKTIAKQAGCNVSNTHVLAEVVLWVELTPYKSLKQF